MLCYVMLCYVMLCYVMLCYVMLCYVMLCYVMLCYVMLCYVMLVVIRGFWDLLSRASKDQRKTTLISPTANECAQPIRKQH